MKSLSNYLLLFSFLILISCTKETIKTDFTDELSNEEAQLVLPSSNFSMEVLETLKADCHDYYVEGKIEYKLEADQVAVVDFGDGESDSKVLVIKGESESEFDCNQKECYYKGKKSKYKKIIVEPIVKTEDCQYIVSGIIKYYEISTGNWVATIDFGEGTCDDIATKTTSDGELITFSLGQCKK